jgi:hypothetical protein
MTEQQRKEWDRVFGRLSYACGTGSEILRNAYQNEGLRWLNREMPGVDWDLLDRDDGHKGDQASVIASLVEYDLAIAPQAYPPHTVDTGLTAKPGARCSRTGVWMPQQWLDGAHDYSLAFCVEGRPMQPAYRILGKAVRDIWADYYSELGWDRGPIDPSHMIGSLVTRAEDTTWHFVHKPDDTWAKAPAAPTRQRCEGGQPCPREGFWFTPAKLGSRRRFQHGETMPVFSTDYGTTIWQWDDSQ